MTSEFRGIWASSGAGVQLVTMGGEVSFSSVRGTKRASRRCEALMAVRVQELREPRETPSRRTLAMRKFLAGVMVKVWSAP